ncbi:MAG TPA: hypothetical protein VFD70_27800 [Anaerolineae bacterium]|nr:hypothetical protein [Anaerolineae bacterium]
MIRTNLLGSGIACLVCVIGLLGCQQRPAVPTVALEPTEPVVVVVVTATSQPTLAPTDTPEASITPIPTLTEVVSATVSTAQTTATRAPTRRPATAKPTTAPQATTAQPTVNAPAPTAAPSSFPAPQAIRPEGETYREGDTLKLYFTSVGPLPADVCYRIDIRLINPGVGEVGDWWVGLCGNQSNPGDQVRFDIQNRKQFAAPNYGSLLDNAGSQIGNTPQYQMLWTVSVVRKLDNDPLKPKVEALSPASAPLQDTFFR